MFNNKPIPPPGTLQQRQDLLSQALGDRDKLKAIKERTDGIRYEPKPAPEKKVFSPRQESVDL